MNDVKTYADGTLEMSDSIASSLSDITAQAKASVIELIEVAGLKTGDMMVIGCSTSEVTGKLIGHASVKPVAGAILDGILPVLKENGIFLAAQCCEHLNRALIIERSCAQKYGLDEVSVRPAPKAGGSFATVAYEAFENPVAVETVKAHAGIDIGGTLIGMHLRHVAVPVRLKVSKIGEANIICARVRPKYIGGPRAIYD